MDIPRAPQNKTKRRVMMAGAGLGALLLATVAIGRLKPAAPSVERSTVWIDGVKRGPMLRQVRGPGTLVPDSIRWISAVTSGRVERVFVRPGAVVRAGTILLDMSNPDVQLEALTSEQQLAAAQAQLVSLRTNLNTSRLNQASTVAQVRTQLREAQRQLVSAESLITRNLIAQNELQRVRDQVAELTERLQIEQERLGLMAETVDSQLTLQQDQINRLRAISEYQRNRVASMHVLAGTDGVVQDLNLEMGQWVQSGTTLARVVQPGKLRAVLRVPETQARDVALGQKAEIDTRIGIVPGRVVRIDPAAQSGTVAVDVALEGALPQGARPDLSVEGTVEIERLDNVLFVGRPAYGQQNSTVGLFKLSDGGRYAERVNVRLGRASVNTIEVLGGLVVGDSVVLSDMSRWDNVDRVRLK
ncbi:MAG: RND transporter [Gemmatimonadetes bacterium GWC2_71_9]|nr:MAG: RND transporter [Gemmatimonadetes bacterium GWC2_71_9]OGT97299.1 MAG: RND transporter [Gemmatimonadetes bacterium RIFCSPLOWO2_02_FULL_71_11]